MKKIVFISSLIFSMIFLSGNSFAQETKEDLYSFGGHAFTHDFPIELGQATLYNENQDVIDIVPIDTLGYYYFYNKPSGNYYIETELVLGDPNFGSFWPTLYPGTIYWEDAQLIEITENNWELDIRMYFNGENPPSGSGKIAGTIRYENSIIEVEGINVMIFDEEMNPIFHYPTDQFGTFSFENLEFGTFIVYPQVLGYTTEPVYIHITNDQMIHEDIQITIKDGTISSYINEDIITENSFLFFPNPSSDNVNIQFETVGHQDIQAKIFDLSGRMIYESSSKNTALYSNTIETRDWQNGYYFIEVLVNGKTAITQKMAVIH